MKCSTTHLILFLSIGWLSLSIQLPSSALPVSPTPEAILVGVASINITPATPIPMSGYGNRPGPYQAVHDSLYATAMVFSDGQQKAVIITADLIGFSNDFASTTIAAIEKETQIDQSYILLTATHNHGGPVNRTYGEDASPDVNQYVETLQRQLIRVVQEASNKMEPALIGQGNGTCTMNINRRARLADGSIWLGRNPDGPCDHDVAVVRIDDLEKKPRAIFVNWPCHGTVSGQENYQLTGDWPGATARFVEKAFDDQVIVPVTAGASADINPIYGPNDQFRDIDAIGMLLGEEVERVARSVVTYPAGSIEAVQMTVQAAGKKRLESRLPDQGLEPDVPLAINLSVLKIGNLLFAGISGELMTEIGMQIKEASPFKHTIILTHCNGSSGYLCTDAAYPEGGYEVMVTRAMPGTADLIAENLKKMIHSLH